MKLRTTVQLSSAIASTSQKSKPPLKREDSFLKRFSTRQVPETQETVDNGDDTEIANGSQTQHEVNRRRRKKREELSRTVVNPDENFYLFWLLVVAACVLYNLWALIVRQSFPEFQKLGGFTWDAIDFLTDLVYVLDIMVQFRTGYLEQGLMVYNSKKLAVHYMKSRAFTLDTLSMTPLDLLQPYVGANPILRFPRFLKVYRVYNYYYMVESRTVYPNLWRVANLIHILLILAHWFGCFYYLISEAEGFKGGWVYPFRDGEYATLTRKYLGSLYWSTLTLTTIGDLPTPETDAEYLNSTLLNGTMGLNETSFLNGSKVTSPFDFDSPIRRRGHKSRLLQFKTARGYLFTIVSYLIGVFIFATIVGQVGNVITNRNANRLEFERLLDGAKTYMRHHKVPGGMKRRVLRWYDYSWSRGRIQGGGDINTALGLLPDKLKTELALHVNLSVLKKVTIFQECQPEFLHDLVLKMKAYIFTPGDLICRKGEVAREMFIIADGILDVISENGRVLTTMNAGDFFGEIGILNLDGLNKRTADVRSVGYSELFSLSREDVLAAMKDYPEAQDILQTLGRKRLMEAKNASKMHKPTALKPAKPALESSGTEAAGKNIVEKLRSDVKGLRSVLRRSRRGTTAKEPMEIVKNTEAEKSVGKKHTPLTRMSHVHSSEEHDDNNESQSPVGAGLPLLHRLRLLKEKENQKSKKKESNIELQLLGSGASLLGKSKTAKPDDKPSPVAGPSGLQSTVRTQVRFDKASKSITITSPQSLAGSVSTEIEEPASTKQKDSAEPAKSHQEPEKPKSASKDGDVQPQPSSSAASLVGEIDKAVPKILEEVSKRSKEAWRLLKISSISSAKSGKKPKGGDSEKGEYLSKSDTVLEKPATVEQAKDEDKRARSISPSLGLKESGDSTADGGSIEDQRSRALGHLPRGNSMKKYESICDLSPEYSGLPFVKKLEILNERQKMSKLEEEETDSRSASLEVQDPESPTYERPLVRSQSEVGTMETRGPDLMLPFGGLSFQEDGGSSMTKAITVEDFRQTDPPSQPQAELTSPESNETFERQHLKTILKKLSAEERSILSNQGEEESTDVKDTAEMKKLMRAPTVEGYAARHKKLTKGVTFDSEPVLNPLATEIDFGSDTDSSDGEDSANPASILGLQILTLSMIPMSGKRVSGEEKAEKGKEKPDDETDSSKKPDDQADSSKKPDDETDLSKKPDDETDSSKKPDDQADSSEKPDDQADSSEKPDDETDSNEKPDDQADSSEKPDDETDSSEKPDDETDTNEKPDDQADLSKKPDGETDSSEKPVDQADLSKTSDDETDLSKKDDDETDLVKKGEGEEEPETSYDTEVAEKADVEKIPSEDVQESPAASQDDNVKYESQEAVLVEMITGIQQSVQGLLGDVKRQFQARVDDLERKVKERDDLIIELQARLFELNVRKRVEVLTKGPNGEIIEILVPITSDEPVIKEQQQPPADGEAIPEEEKEGESSAVEEAIPVDEKGNVILEPETEVTPAVEEYMSQPSTSQGIVATEPPQVEEEYESTSEDEIEAFRQAAEDRVPPPISSFRERKYIKEYRAKRNYSVDDAETYQKLRPQKSESGDWEFPSQFTLRRRKNIAKSQPIQVETETETESSDAEAVRNEDWEIQMLLEELEKEEIRKKALEKMQRELEKELRDELEEELDEEDIESVKQLQEELDSLKKIVQESDLSQLSTSEYNMLEKMLDEKDQKISQIAKSRSLDEDDTGKRTRRSLHDWDPKSDKGEGKKKSTLRRRLGQALSFDFHDIDRKKGKSSDSSKRIKFPIKRKSIAGSRFDKGSFYGLFHSSKKLGKKIEKVSSAPVDTTSRVSLPALSTCEIEDEKASDTRTSLPTLSSQQTYPECSTASVGSVDNVAVEIEQSPDSVFEIVSGENLDLEMQMPSPRPSTSGLQSFFKTVGQKVKRAMSTEGSTVKQQVPTISIICEDKSPFKKGKQTPPIESRVEIPEDESMGEDREGSDQEPQPGPSQV